MSRESFAPQRLRVPGGWLFALGPYLILAVAAGFLYANWNSIPASFPMHWGRNGLPDRWVNRTVMGVFGLLMVGVLSNTVTILIASGVFFGNSTGDIVSKRAVFFVILLVDYFISTLFAVIATRPAWSADPVRSPSQLAPSIALSVLALIAGIVVYLVHASRSRMGSEGGTPGQCWKWGLFYSNPDDPAIFVEKRIGFGWTLNFAHRKAWTIMALMLLPPVLIILGTLFAVRSTR